MTYRLVYDVTQDSPAWGFPLFGLLFVGVGLLMVFARDRLPSNLWRGPAKTSPRFRAAVGLFFLGFSVLWTAITSWAVFGQHFAAQRTLRDGEGHVVEGVVEHFHPMPASGHDTERFTVGDVHFEYSDFVVRPGFRNTSSHGGPMREGLPVRITWTGERERATILRLEVAQESP